MDDVPLLLIAELFIFVSIIDDLTYALLQIFAVRLRPLELQVWACFAFNVCHILGGIGNEVQDRRAEEHYSTTGILYMAERSGRSGRGLHTIRR